MNAENRPYFKVVPNLKAHGEAYQPTEEELQARAKKHAEWRHEQALKSAVAEAEEAF